MCALNITLFANDTVFTLGEAAEESFLCYHLKHRTGKRFFSYQQMARYFEGVTPVICKKLR